MENELNQNTKIKINYLIENPKTTIRIDGNDFRKMLLYNYNISINNKKRYLQGIDIGMNVVKATLLPEGWEDEFGTLLLDAGTEWIKEGTRLVLEKRCKCDS